MPDNILDDVKKLLDAEVGDKKVLGQIKRAAENNEAISNYERNYVAKLAEQYLKPPEPEPEIYVEPIEEETSIEKEKEQTIYQETSQTLVGLKPTENKNKKLMIGGGAVALAIIIAVAIGYGGVDFGSGVTPPTLTSSPLATDKSSYAKGDIISISGKAKTNLGDSVSLSIENANSELIWMEDLTIKDSGAFSTLVIAGGPGWENSGTYTLKAKHGSEDYEVSFSFRS